MTAWRPRERASWSFLYGVLSFGLIACGGGGCGGCGDGCGVAPIPGGFPIEQRVPNSAQVRLTDEGIAFLENNADALVGLALPDGLEFAVPPTTTSQSIAVCGTPTIQVCQSGNCLVRGDITSLNIEPLAPNAVRATIRLILESRVCTARSPDGSCTASTEGPLDVRLRDSFLCSGGVLATIDTREGSREDIGLIVEVELTEETEAARRGTRRLWFVEPNWSRVEISKTTMSTWTVTEAFLGSSQTCSEA